MFKNKTWIIIALIILVIIVGSYFFLKSAATKAKTAALVAQNTSQVTGQVNAAQAAPIAVIGNQPWTAQVGDTTKDTIGTSFQAPHLLDRNAGQFAVVSVAPDASQPSVSVVSRSSNAGPTVKPTLATTSTMNSNPVSVVANVGSLNPLLSPVMAISPQGGLVAVSGGANPLMDWGVVSPIQYHS